MNIKIAVKNMQKERYEIETNTDSTIATLKTLIKEKDNEGNNMDLLLIYSGKILTDTNTVGSYGITDTSEIVKLYKPKKEVVPEHVPTPQQESTQQPVQSDNMFEQGNNEQNDVPENMEEAARNFIYNLAKQEIPDITEEQFNQVYDSTIKGKIQMPQQKIELNYTEAEQNDVTELINMGFREMYVHQYYNACDKSKELAMNMLYDMGEEARSNGDNQQIPLNPQNNLPNDLPNDQNQNQNQNDPNSQNNIEQLVNMGFDRDHATNVLKACNGDLNNAINMLLN